MGFQRLTFYVSEIKFTGDFVIDDLEAVILHLPEWESP